ncbi:hypothetical protein [Sphingobium yanoikuyae]|uniref:hypothetical protein n=1 Tax=Sphingobium yanoikuyae TaxID=13690 RepID=UPI0028B01B64|nr:hypothetical protein [Sphingobium yanoikuyae]
MKAYVATAAFGWLVFTGIAHFVVDVVSQHLRGKRTPSVETSLYYGLNSSFALGQVVFGLTCLWIAAQQPNFLRSLPVAAFCLAAALGWLGIAFLFMEYWEPKANMGIFVVLLVAAIIAAR